MRRFNSCWIVIAAFVLLTRVASANMITTNQTVYWDGSQAAWSSAPTGSIGLFDSTLGTLTSVQLDFSGTAWGSLTLNQVSNNQETLGSSFGATITLADVLQNPMLTIAPTNTFSDTFMGKEKLTHAVLEAGAASDSVSSLYTTDLSRWIGSGNWVVTGAALDVITVDKNKLKPAGTVFANATLKVTYTYDDDLEPPDPTGTPEPAAFLLIGSGLLGLGLLFRRRSA